MREKNSPKGLSVRPASLEELDRIMEIYGTAREFMRKNGNASQWVNGYPDRELLASDIASGHLYVCVNPDDPSHEERICGVFCFVAGPDPTYQIIEKGSWLSDLPYHVIHRLASDGSYRGITSICLDWCFRQDRNIRVDTHEDNTVMQHLLEKNGFERCGIIYVEDGSPRLAYQKTI